MKERQHNGKKKNEFKIRTYHCSNYIVYRTTSNQVHDDDDNMTIFVYFNSSNKKTLWNSAVIE